MAITVLKSWRTPRKGGSLAFKDKKETERRKSESGKRTVRTARKPKGQYCFPWSSEEMQRRSTYIADRTVSRRTSTRLSSHASDRRGKDLAKAALMPFAIRRARENTGASSLYVLFHADPSCQNSPTWTCPRTILFRTTTWTQPQSPAAQDPMKSLQWMTTWMLHPRPVAQICRKMILSL